MQQVALGQSGVTYLQSRSRGKEPSRPSETTRVERNTLGAERSAKPAEAGVGSARETQPGSNAALTNNSSWLPFGPPEFAQLSVQVAGALVEDQPGSPTRNESDRLLEKLVETMEDVKRVLIGTQRSFARVSSPEVLVQCTHLHVYYSRVQGTLITRIRGHMGRLENTR